MLVTIFLEIMANMYWILMQTFKKSSLVLLLVALSLLNIAGAGLLQCWFSNILKTRIDRDKIDILDIFITFETQYFISGVQNDLPSAVLHSQVHAWVMLVIILLEIMADLYLFSHTDI